MLPITFRRTVPTRGVHKWSPFSELARLSTEFDRLFDWSNGGRFAWPGDQLRPWVNVYGGDDEVVVTTELPGYNAKDIEVSIEGDRLNLSGTSEGEEASDDDKTYHRRERRSGKFARSVRLPFGVDSNDVSAEFKDGILTVKLPRAAEDKPKKIAVETK